MGNNVGCCGNDRKAEALPPEVHEQDESALIYILTQNFLEGKNQKYQGKYAEATETFQKINEHHNHLQSADPFKVSQVEQELAQVYFLQRQYVSAVELFKQAQDHLDSVRQRQEEEHQPLEALPFQLDVISKLGLCYQRTGQQAVALELLERAYQLNSHLQHASAELGVLGNLAGVLLSFQQENTARQSLQKALVYATELAKNDKDNRALTFLQDSLGSSAFYGSGASSTFGQNSQNMAQYSSKEKKKRLDYYMTIETGDRYLVGNIKLPEQERLLYADCLSNMAMLLERQGRRKDALKHQLAAIALYKGSFRQKAHLKTGLMYYNLAMLYQRVPQGRKSLKYLLEALQIFLALCGEYNDYVVDTLIELGRMSEQTGDLSQAIVYFRRSIKVIQKNNQENELVHLQAMQQLQSVFCRLGHYDQALELCKEIISQISSTQGKQSLESLQWSIQQAHLNKRAGYTDNAILQFEKCLKKVRLIFPQQTNKHFVVITNCLGELYLNKKQPQKASQYFKSVLQYDPSCLDTQQIIVAQFQYASCLFNLKNYSLARDHFQLCLQVMDSYQQDDQQHIRLLATQRLFKAGQFA